MGGKRVVVIGAAPVLTTGPFQDPTTPEALAAFVDGCDVVIRMNNLKNFGAPGEGTRTDVHVVTNTGKPGRRYARKARLDARLLRGARQVWFGTDPELIGQGELRREEGPDADAERDWAPDIVARQGWQDRDWSYIDAAIVRRVRDAIGGRSNDPSVGARVIARVLEDERYAGHTVHLIGFGFAGSKAHDWDAERAWVTSLLEQGRVGRVPGHPRGADFPHEEASRRARRLAVWRHPRTVCRLRGKRLWPLNF